MSQDISTVFRIVCPDCKIYITYTGEEVKEAIKNSYFTCKRCQKQIPITLGRNESTSKE